MNEKASQAEAICFEKIRANVKGTLANPNEFSRSFDPKIIENISKHLGEIHGENGGSHEDLTKSVFAKIESDLMFLGFENIPDRWLLGLAIMGYAYDGFGIGRQRYEQKQAELAKSQPVQVIESSPDVQNTGKYWEGFSHGVLAASALYMLIWAIRNPSSATETAKAVGNNVGKNVGNRLVGHLTDRAINVITDKSRR